MMWLIHPLVLLAQDPAPGAPEGAVERRAVAMGTALSLSVEAESRAEALAASEAALRAIEAAEARLSTWRDDSELARLNRTPAGAPFAMSPELAAELAIARRCWAETRGAFDPGLGVLIEAWGLRTGGRVPSAEERNAALVPGGFGALELDGRRAVRRDERLRVEEGGFGKGAGLDAALAALRASGARRAVLDLGGQLAVLGDAGPEGFAFAVADPDRRERTVLRMAIDAGSVSTSGNAERAVEVHGVRYGHLLDPRTGSPSPDFGSLTVWAPDATAADCLSTGLFVLGPLAALEWAETHEGVEVLVLERTAGGLRARASAGLAGRLTPLAGDVVLTFGMAVETTAAGRGLASEAALTGGGQESSLERLAREDEELRRRIDVVAGEVERFQLKDLLAPGVGESAYGFGPAASKIYRVEQGLSIGGYGEFLYEDFQGSGTDAFDALRAVLYFGYKFDEHWLFNSEIELEHASTSSNPDGQSGEASVEFAYVEFRTGESFGTRGGLLLLPVGFVNELHEPTTFLSSERPFTEQVLLPTTWRENGVGVFGAAGGFDWRSYVVTGLDGEGFSAAGLRGGRQKGNRADAEDFAWVSRVDWAGTPGVLAGGSLYLGESGQETGLDVPTRIYEAHLEWRGRGLRFRALGALADLDEVRELNALANGGPLTGTASIGEELIGWYAELGYDVLGVLLPESGQSLTPFIRWEEVDTQDEVPRGFSSNPANDSEIATFGLAYQPIDNVILKLDYQDWDNDADSALDQWNIAIGYIF